MEVEHAVVHSFDAENTVGKDIYLYGARILGSIDVHAYYHLKLHNILNKKLLVLFSLICK